MQRNFYRECFVISFSLVLLCATTLSAQTYPSQRASSDTLQNANAETLTLERSVKIAIDNAITVLKAQNSKELSGMQLLQAYGSFLPNLSVSAGYTPISQSNNLSTLTDSSGRFPLIGNKSRSANYSISSSLNLFNGFSDYAQLKQSMLLQDSRTYTFERAKQDIAFNVAQSYLQILLNDELLRINRENLKSSQEQARQLKEQTRLGSKALADLYQQEAQVSANELNVITAENTLRNSKLTLLRQLRLDPKEYSFIVPVADSSLLGIEYLDVNRLVNSALNSRTDLKAFELQMNSDQWSITKSRSGYFPRLNLNFTYGSNASTTTNYTRNGTDIPLSTAPDFSRQFSDQYNYSISLGLSWTIFDRFTTQVGIESALINAKNSRLDFEDKKLQVVSEVNQAVGDYKTAVARLRSTESGLTSATLAFETVQKRYQVGSATFVELAAAQTSLVTAQSNRAQAVLNFTFQKKILEYYLGTIDLSKY